MIEFEYRKIEFWVIPIFIIICLFNEMFDKVVTVVFVLLFALKFNNNHFTHQRFRINRRFLPRCRKRKTFRQSPTRLLAEEVSEKELIKANRYNLTLAIKDREEHDSDSIHSFDLDDLNQSVSSSLGNLFLNQKIDDMDEHFEEIERILTPWGPEEYKKFQNEIKFVTKQENGLYLSDEEIESWRKKEPIDEMCQRNDSF